ncbi:hypothetical protein LAZ67_13002649 [Cordylochernes scorpioides]|uniref:Uncharacterized protein n=1 Tax=Cordylochernes scorpioides TaxID=51811 RepID=A0ABY6L4P9_9ARAC|nr:hypothetical protein LAZ67_13002649 [Cordylochernes scorpioides]
MAIFSKGCILEDYPPKGQTLNSIVYSELLEKILKPKIRSKRRSLLSKGVCLHHDNARRNMANVTIEFINKLNFKGLNNSSYSPNLARINIIYLGT